MEKYAKVGFDLQESEDENFAVSIPKQV